MSVIDFRRKQIAKLGPCALIICPCGQEHVMKLDEKRECRCGLVYGKVEDERAQEFLDALDLIASRLDKDPLV